MTSVDHALCVCGCGKPGDWARGMCLNGYKRFRDREIAYGRWQPYVPVDDAREHLAALMAAGLRLEHVVKLTGVSRTAINHIADPTTERIETVVAAAVLEAEIPARPSDVTADTALVPIIGAARRIQALIAYGYTRNYLAGELGMDPSQHTMASLVGRPKKRGTASMGRFIIARRDRQIKELFDRLQLAPGPSDRARAHGRRRNWALPFEWDEDSIDRPDAVPVRAAWNHSSTWSENRVQVHRLVSRGLDNQQVADRLGLAKRSVERLRKARLTDTEISELNWGNN